MTNSDYLIKAAIKKLSEKLNQTFIEKIEEATSVAQEVPNLLKKELEILIDEILQEAKKIEDVENPEKNHAKEINEKSDLITKCSSKVNSINAQLKVLNKKFKY